MSFKRQIFKETQYLFSDKLDIYAMKVLIKGLGNFISPFYHKIKKLSETRKFCHESSVKMAN